MVPTVHLNVRYFEVTSPAGAVVDAWFGGGTDLTPTYPFPDDAVHFHRTLKQLCERHHPAFHPRFKALVRRVFRQRCTAAASGAASAASSSTTCGPGDGGLDMRRAARVC